MCVKMRFRSHSRPPTRPSDPSAALPYGRALGQGLGFVRLLASANQVVERFGGLDALLLLKLADPIRNVRDHVARGFALGIARSLGAYGSFAAFGALYHFDYF